MKKGIINETILKIVFKSESEDHKYFTLRTISKEELLLINIANTIFAIEDSLDDLIECRIWKEMAILPYIPENITIAVHLENDERVVLVEESLTDKYQIEHKKYLNIENDIKIVATRLRKKQCRELSYYLLTSPTLKDINNI